MFTAFIKMQLYGLCYVPILLISQHIKDVFNMDLLDDINTEIISVISLYIYIH